ncbi:MAG: DUF3040 domain-containing protein [Candidatus Dormibacteria bacterium]
MLSNEDRHALVEIEHRLLHDNPALARRWAAATAHGPMATAPPDTPQPCHYAGVVALSLILLTSGVALHLPVMTALCAVVALSTLVLHARHREHPCPGPTTG